VITNKRGSKNMNTILKTNKMRCLFPLKEPIYNSASACVKLKNLFNY